MENILKCGCDDCRFYRQHYYKGNTGYKKIGYGHCINYEAIKPDGRKKFMKRETCRFWEPAEIRKAERKKLIEEALIDMEESLSQIVMLLNDDKK